MVNMGNFCFTFCNLCFFYTVWIVCVKELQNEIAFRMYFFFENVIPKIYNNLIGCSWILPTNIYSMPACLCLSSKTQSLVNMIPPSKELSIVALFSQYFFFIMPSFSTYAFHSFISIFLEYIFPLISALIKLTFPST